MCGSYLQENDDLRERKKDGVELELNLSFVLYKQKER